MNPIRWIFLAVIVRHEMDMIRNSTTYSRLAERKVLAATLTVPLLE